MPSQDRKSGGGETNMMNDNFLVLDLESGPMPAGDLRVPEFEAARNLRDPEKIKASIAEKEASWLEDAALDARSGQILLIGMLSNDLLTILEGTEKTMLEQVWVCINECGEDVPVVGHNIIGFDLPMMVRRSWRHGVRVPRWVVDDLSKYKAPGWCFDTMLAWSFGNKQERISLDDFAQHLGLPSKDARFGKDYARNFAKNFAADPEQAKAYLANDLALARDVYLKVKGQG
jgi:3'-5' exonuclease